MIKVGDIEKLPASVCCLIVQLYGLMAFWMKERQAIMRMSMGWLTARSLLLLKRIIARQLREETLTGLMRSLMPPFLLPASFHQQHLHGVQHEIFLSVNLICSNEKQLPLDIVRKNREDAEQQHAAPPIL